MTIPILITSSVVAYDSGVSLKDTSSRLNLTLDSIQKWVTVSPDSPIVICDGSNHNFEHDIKKLFPNHHIESICFENNQELVKKKGRGYGEGEIIRYAIENSILLKIHKSFAKCSAKLWVRNFKSCIKNWDGNFKCKGVFSNPFSPHTTPSLLSIDTRFYISSTQFYYANFANAHTNIIEGSPIGLEEKFAEIANQKRMKDIFLCPPPIIEGTGGGTGKIYKTTAIRQAKDTLKHMIAIRRFNK